MCEQGIYTAVKSNNGGRKTENEDKVEENREKEEENKQTDNLDCSVRA